MSTIDSGRITISSLLSSRSIDSDNITECFVSTLPISLSNKKNIWGMEEDSNDYLSPKFSRRFKFSEPKSSAIPNTTESEPIDNKESGIRAVEGKVIKKKSSRQIKSVKANKSWSILRNPLVINTVNNPQPTVENHEYAYAYGDSKYNYDTRILRPTEVADEKSTGTHKSSFRSKFALPPLRQEPHPLPRVPPRTYSLESYSAPKSDSSIPKSPFHRNRSTDTPLSSSSSVQSIEESKHY